MQLFLVILLNVFLILKLYRITRRPKGASNTDYLSKNGEASKDAPGFPSGHMTTTAFYSFYNAIENKNNKVLLIIFGGLVVSTLGKIL